MNYSRRQLEALGETLGECVTRKEGGRVIYGGGGSGGGSAPASQTQISDLPEWAKPYAKETLGKASALTDINQNPYQQYTGERIAGFDPMQEQAMRTAASPEAFGQQVQGYMSPYMQNVVDVQKQEAMRSAGILGAQQQAKATQAGAFGGYREGIQRAEDNRNLMRQMNDIQAMGSQRAFEQGAEQARLAQGLQMQYGGMRQALEQQRLGQNYQDFMNQQRYPYQQLEFMSNILRGTPMGTVQTMYQPPSSTLGQLAGLGIGLGGMAQFGRMFNEGGQVDGYADGGSVTSDYKVDEILGNLSDTQLQQARMAALNSRDMRRVEAIDEELAERASLRSGLGGAFNSLPEDTQEAVTEMATGGIVAFDEGGRVERYSDGGTMAGFFSSPEDMSLDELRVQNELRRRAEEDRYSAIVEGREPTPAPQRSQPAPQAAPQPAPQTAPKAAPETAAPRAQRRPAVTAQSASEAVKTISEAARVQIPKDETRELTKSLLDELMKRPNAQQEEFQKELESAKNRAKEIEARGIGEAMMKFGFTMAAAAAKPGAGSGLSGALKSAAAASPAFAESMAENAKLKQAAEDNYMKLRMENARYQTAVEQGNMQLAATLANNISQRKLAQATLQEQINRNAQTLDIEREKLGIMRSQSGRPGSALEMAYNVLSRDPKNAGKSETDLLEMASKSVGAASSYRTDTSALVQAEKMKKELMEKRRLFASSDSKFAKEQIRLIDEDIRRLDATLGSKGGVGSGTTTGWSGKQVGD